MPSNENMLIMLNNEIDKLEGELSKLKNMREKLTQLHVTIMDKISYVVSPQSQVSPEAKFPAPSAPRSSAFDDLAALFKQKKDLTEAQRRKKAQYVIDKVRYHTHREVAAAIGIGVGMVSYYMRMAKEMKLKPKG